MLVFDLNRGGAGRFQFADGPLDVDRLAESGVGIDDQRDRDASRKPGRLLGQFGEREQADIGHRQFAGRKSRRRTDRLRRSQIAAPAGPPAH